jgi:hypothetical protein
VLRGKRRGIQQRVEYPLFAEKGRHLVVQLGNLEGGGVRAQID